MHPQLLEEIVALCQRRHAQGDHPTEQIADAEVLENAIVQLSAAVNVRGPVTTALQADALQWRRECEDADQLLGLLGLDPQEYRTDGGSINMPKVRAALATPSRAEPAGWRDVLKDIRLGLAAGSRSQSNTDFELDYGRALLDAVAEKLEDLYAATPSRVAEPAEKYDDVLAPFVALMRKELHANSGKGDRPGWLSMSRQTAMLEIWHHAAKLQKAALNDDRAAIREHAADVANMSMMLLDVCGGLEPTGPGHTPNSALPPIGDGPRRKMVVTVEVPADWEKRLDMQWVLEREIHADRWSWDWKASPEAPR